MKRKAHPHEHQGELNIVPYLDIMVNLVMFMLMSMTGFVTFMNLNVNVPSIARSADPTPKPKEDEKLNLSVLMSAKGYYIAAKGGTLPPDATGVVSGDSTAVNMANPTIPVKFGKDFEYDYDKLHQVMEDIKKSNPAVTQYNLTPDPTVKYDCIVKTMDNVRGTPDHILFPDVAFAAIKKT